MASSEQLTTSSAMSLEQALSATRLDTTDEQAAEAQRDGDGDNLAPPSDSAIYTRRGSLFAPGPVQMSQTNLPVPTLSSSNNVRDTQLGDGTAGAPHSQPPTTYNDSQSATQPDSSQTMTGAVNFAGDSDAKQVLLIELLLVSGKRMRWRVAEGTSVSTVKQVVWQAWPTDWRGQEELPPSPDSLRLLYMGKFLDDGKTLESYGIRPSAELPTIVHLVIRPLVLPEDTGETAALKPYQKQSSVCCIVS
ncbi:hypothetical protein ACM66B_004344 [Microbotryomycetes sp. NB124-2]